jgi:hypothetical protein
LLQNKFCFVKNKLRVAFATLFFFVYLIFQPI